MFATIIKNLEGKEFGKLTVIKRVDSPDNHRRWLCECECGNLQEYYTYELTNGSKVQCGKCGRKDRGEHLINDLSGRSIGQLTVLNFDREKTRKEDKGSAVWKCQCSCGNITYKTSVYLTTRKNPNCGCADKERDGRSKTRLYRIYKGMNDRCNNEKHQSYRLYGARGITICEEWSGEDGFDNFRDWSLKNGYEDYLSIDRIDNDKGYSPDNCRWADDITQGNNTRHCRKITYNGKTQTMTQWARELGLTVATIRGRMKYSDNIDDILSRPIDTKYHKWSPGTYTI